MKTIRTSVTVSGIVLPAANEERDVRPAPVVDLQAHRDERLSGRVGRDTRHGEVPVVLPPNDVRRVDVRHRDEHVALAVGDGVHRVPRGRLHRDHAQHLHQVVLHDVAHRADLVVERATIGDVEVLGHRDLDRGDELPVPDRFEHGVREPQEHHVDDRQLPQEVVDAVQLRLVDVGVELGVERLRRSEVVAEGLLDHDPRAGGEAGVVQAPYDAFEQRRWDLQVVHRDLRIAESRGEARVRVGIVEVALHVLQAGDEALEHRIVERRVAERVAGVLAQVVERPVVDRDTDHGALQQVAPLEQVERLERHLLGEVAADAEHDERIGHCLPGAK